MNLYLKLFFLLLAPGPGLVLAQNPDARLLKTFTNPTAAPFGLFGGSVAGMGSDRVLIGAEGAAEAYLFSSGGTLLTTFTDPTSSGLGFGSAVAAMGDERVLIGDYNYSASHQGQLRQLGRAYLFATNGTLLTTFTNPNPSAGQAFGWSVAAVGSDRVLISGLADLNKPGPYPGTVYLFSTSGALITTFTDPNSAADNDLGNGFGVSTAAFGNDRVLIGAPEDDTGASRAGVAYLFSTNGTLLTTFTNPAPVASDNFGTAVAAVGSDRVLISAIDYGGTGNGGAAYLFNTNGTLLTTFPNPTPEANDYFGWSVAAVGSNRVLIGAYQDGTGAFQSGSAYLFSTNGTLLTTLTNPTPATQDFFGLSVAAVGSDQVIIGSVWKDTGAPDAGAAYLFDLPYPPLGIARNGSTISVSWTTFETGIVLQQSEHLAAPDSWIDTVEPVSVTGQAHVFEQDITGGPARRFYRLHRP